MSWRAHFKAALEMSQRWPDRLWALRVLDRYFDNDPFIPSTSVEFACEALELDLRSVIALHKTTKGKR